MSGAPGGGFVHRFESGESDAPVLLALHGTGGNESSLIDLARSVAPGWPILSPRGRVDERGMPRFFRRLAEGVFDFDDVRAQADALAEFVREQADARGLAARPVVAFGYSNGANIAAALLLRHPRLLAGGVLVRPMVPLPESPEHPPTGARVLLTAGAADPICPPEQAAELATRLRRAGAAAEVAVLPADHGLIREDLVRAARHLAGFRPGADADADVE